MARLYAIANQKGGVGKSTTAVNVAAYLGAWGRKTLLVDLDPQGNATSGVGIAHDASRPNIYTVLIEGRPVEDAILETSDAMTSHRGLYVSAGAAGAGLALGAAFWRIRRRRTDAA